MAPILSFELPVLVGLCALFWFLVFRPLKKDRARRKDPFTKDLLRAPGESCFEKISDLDEKLDSALMLAVMPPLALIGYALGVHQASRNSPIIVAILLITALGVSVAAMLRSRAIIRQRIRYRLGFQGERHAAQALIPLASDGYRIYHDLQCRKPGTSEIFNIDHVLFGPAGVIAIETKTRSKRPKGENKVTFDGKTLDFGAYRDSHGIDQALANAASLARLLENRTGCKIPVIPMLCLPGWWVERKALAPLFVANPAEIPSRVRGLPPFRPTDTKLPKQITTFLEELSAAKID